MVLTAVLGCGSEAQPSTKRVSFQWQRLDVPDPAAVYMLVAPQVCQELREVVIRGRGGQVSLTASGVEWTGEDHACALPIKRDCVRVPVRGHRPTEEFLDGVTQLPAPTAARRISDAFRAQRAEGHDCPLIAVRDRRH